MENHFAHIERSQMSRIHTFVLRYKGYLMSVRLHCSDIVDFNVTLVITSSSGVILITKQVKNTFRKIKLLLLSDPDLQKEQI